MTPRDLLDRVVALEELLDLLRQLVDRVDDELELLRGSVFRTWASLSATRKSSDSCAVNVLDAATLTSRPARVYSTSPLRA